MPVVKARKAKQGKAVSKVRTVSRTKKFNAVPSDVQSLGWCIETYLNVDPKSSDFYEIAEAVVRYILKESSAYKCQERLNAVVDFSELNHCACRECSPKRGKQDETIECTKSTVYAASAQKFRLRLLELGYLHLNLKFYLYNFILFNIKPDDKATIKKLSSDFGIPKADQKIVQHLMQKRGFRVQMLRSEQVKKIRKDQITKKAFDDLWVMFNDIYPEILKHVKKKTYNKLRFITVSSNVDRHDFHMELMQKALLTFIKNVPTNKGRTFLCNYIRSAINNHVVNIIKSYTAQKRSRMQEGQTDGFGCKEWVISVVSENQLLRAFGEDVSYDTLQANSVNQTEEDIRDGVVSLRMVLKRFGYTKKRKIFIRLISGQYHKGFTMFLRESGVIAEDFDNEEYLSRCCNRVHGKYLTTICKYLGVTKSGAKKLMKDIKNAYS